MKLGPLQQRAIAFLVRAGKPVHFNYRTAKNRRIVDSLERRGLISVYRYPPTACRDALVTLLPTTAAAA
jgi:DNA-binding MarR family transcriptional regulator